MEKILDKNFIVQLWTKYLRQTVVLCKIGHYRKSSISDFQKFFASIEKNFHFVKKTEH